MSGGRSVVWVMLRGFPLCGLLAILLTTPFGLTACAQPVVTLGALADVDGPTDEDGIIDEAERERLFRELAERECREDEPVCSTEGITYRNYCQAIANAAQVLHAGPC